MTSAMPTMAIAQNLEAKAQVNPTYILIFIQDDYSDWSVGHGRFAMGLVQQVEGAYVKR